MRTLSPRTRSCSLLVLSVVLSLVIGCDADTTLSLDVDVALLASRGGDRLGGALEPFRHCDLARPGRPCLAGQLEQRERL